MRGEIVEKVRAAGVVGAGGAGFPTHVKLDTQVERVIANGASCEPLLMSDPFLMEHETESVLRGLHLAMQSTGAARGTICLKAKHSRALAAVKARAGGGRFEAIDVFELADFYPAGDEQVLVYEVMGRVVPEGGIPLQVGAVVSNVESLLNLTRAVEEEAPVTEKYLTVAGEVARSLVLKVPIGISAGEVVALAGGATVPDFRILMGGPMMGVVADDASEPVTKTTGGVIVLPADHNVVLGKVNDPARLRHITQVVCCQCTRCTDLCPRYLLGHSLEPHRIMRQLGSRSTAAQAVMKDALLCCECGVCEKYACPMMISPREVNAQIKRALLEEGAARTPGGEAPRPSAFRDVRRIPTKRLTERLKIGRYDRHPEFFREGVEPKKVTLPLKQHLGSPALPRVKPGDRVKRGDLIAEIPEKALGARVHASMDGTVTSVAEAVVIES